MMTRRIIAMLFCLMSMQACTPQSKFGQSRPVGGQEMNFENALGDVVIGIRSYYWVHGQLPESGDMSAMQPYADLGVLEKYTVEWSYRKDMSSDELAEGYDIVTTIKVYKGKNFLWSVDDAWTHDTTNRAVRKLIGRPGKEPILLPSDHNYATALGLSVLSFISITERAPRDWDDIFSTYKEMGGRDEVELKRLVESKNFKMSVKLLNEVHPFGKRYSYQVNVAGSVVNVTIGYDENAQTVYQNVK